ncbi:MAG: hypothetical protein V1774_02320 [Candidatus Eisenbacteria bacterium]
MIVIPTPASASPAAMELGQRIVNLIEEFHRQRPGTSAQDVRQALRIAATHSAPMQRMRVMILVLVALLVGSVIAFWARMR